MTARTLTILLLALTTLLLTACGDEASADDPPEIEYGRDVCSRCNMIISEERFAAGTVDPDGNALVYDDIGEMIVVLQDEGVPGGRIWVHDADSLEWIDATTAHYVASPDVVTPMGSGVTAFEDRDAASAFAGENAGEVLTWEEMLETWEWAMHRRMH